MCAAAAAGAQERVCADAGPDAVVLLYLYLDSCGICKCVVLPDWFCPMEGCDCAGPIKFHKDCMHNMINTLTLEDRSEKTCPLCLRRGLQYAEVTPPQSPRDDVF